MIDVVYQRSPRFVSRRLDGELLLVPISAGAADMDSIFILNEVASFIWETVDGQPLERLVAAMTSAFDVAAEDAARDARALLGELAQMGALVPGGSAR